MSSYDTQSILAAKTVFMPPQNVSAFGTIQAMVAASTPIAQTLNAMAALPQHIETVKANALQQDPNAQGVGNQVSVNFKDIDRFYSFAMYKVIKPKIIYARYISRVVPDQMNQSLMTTYYPQIVFKIDYDGCCIGAMMLMFTMDVQVGDYSNQMVQINGYSSKGMQEGIQVHGSQITSFQFSYCEDFFYNCLNTASLGFCNTGGNAPIYHQEIPAEIIKVYHDLIDPIEIGETTKRMVREDMFVIGHTPYHTYGNYSFQMKADNQLSAQDNSGPTQVKSGIKIKRNAISSTNSGFHEIGMYYVSQKIKEIGFSEEYDSPDANLTNFQVGLTAPNLSNVEIDDDETNVGPRRLMGFDLQALSGLKFGFDVSQYKYNMQVGLQVDNSIFRVTKVTAVQTATGNFLTGQIPFTAGAVYYDYNPEDIQLSSTFGQSRPLSKTELATGVVDKKFGGVIDYSFDSSNPISQNVPIMLVSTTNSNRQMAEVFKYVRQHESQYPKLSIQYNGAKCSAGGANQALYDGATVAVTENIVFVPYVFVTLGGTQQQTYETRVALMHFYEIASDEVLLFGNNITFSIQPTSTTVIGDGKTPNVMQFTDSFVAKTTTTGTDREDYTWTYEQWLGYVADGCRVQQLEQTYLYTQDSNQNIVLNAAASKTYMYDCQFSAIISYHYLHLSFDSKMQFAVKTTDNIRKMIGGTSQKLSEYLLQATGAVSPYLNLANLRYMNIEQQPYDLNDFQLNSMQWYYQNQKTSTDSNKFNIRAPDTNSMEGTLSMFRANAAVLNNQENEEYQPTIQNVDYQSIHTPRKYHGIIDFYVPLNFFFICQGIKNSYPHYATASQSVCIKFEWYNPLAFFNTFVTVRPTAIDSLDFSRSDRLFINRVCTQKHLISNISNLRYVLFYTRYVWIPLMINIIAGYKYYNWICKNYERFNRIISVANGSPGVLYQFNRSVFYTKIWVFFTNLDTMSVIQQRGNSGSILPLYVNKFKLQIFDVLTYNYQDNKAGNQLTGQDFNSVAQQYNSVYSLVPIESVQMQTQSQIQMQDAQPFRFQIFNDYINLEKTQHHQPLRFNNLLQFNIDPVFYQEDAPNCNYSPAYAPAFRIEYTPKPYNNQVKEFGAIVISECLNITYIQGHCALSKYQTTN